MKWYDSDDSNDRLSNKWHKLYHWYDIISPDITDITNMTNITSININHIIHYTALYMVIHRIHQYTHYTHYTALYGIINVDTCYIRYIRYFRYMCYTRYTCYICWIHLIFLVFGCHAGFGSTNNTNKHKAAAAAAPRPFPMASSPENAMVRRLLTPQKPQKCKKAIGKYPTYEKDRKVKRKSVRVDDLEKGQIREEVACMRQAELESHLHSAHSALMAIAKEAKRDCAVPVSCQNGKSGENGVSIVRLNELEAAGMYQAELEGRLHLALSAAAKPDGLHADDTSNVAMAPMGGQKHLAHLDCWDCGVQTKERPRHEDELSLLTHETYYLRRMLLDRGVQPQLLIPPGDWSRLWPRTAMDTEETTQRTPAQICHNLASQWVPVVVSVVVIGGSWRFFWLRMPGLAEGHFINFVVKANLYIWDLILLLHTARMISNRFEWCQDCKKIWVTMSDMSVQDGILSCLSNTGNT